MMYLLYCTDQSRSPSTFYFVKGESICFIPVADISLNFVDTEITCIDISPLVSPLQKHLEYCN